MNRQPSNARQSQFWNYGAIALLCLYWSLGDRAWSRPVADNTLGAESSQVQPISDVDFQIRGGARRGQNLFHSFRQFGIDRGSSVYFFAPSDVRTILARVTGDRRSEIRGTLGVNGNANLILMNPNGILFGRNAQLNVAGSFVATTADAIGFGDRGIFSATQPTAPGRLSINPSALLYRQMSPQPIEVYSRRPADSSTDSMFFNFVGLQVENTRSLLLAGGDIRLNGGVLSAPGGVVELGGLSEPGGIKLRWREEDRQFPERPRFEFSPNSNLSNVSFLNDAQVVNVQTASAGRELGGIVIAARQFSADGGRLEASTVTEGDAGAIAILAQESVNLRSMRIATDSQDGNSGDILIAAPNITLSNLVLSFNTIRPGNAGNLIVQAADTLQIVGDPDNPSSLRSQVFTSGNSGSIRLQAGRNLLISNTNITLISGNGLGGEIEVISGGNLEISNNSGLSAQTLGRGNAGDILLRAADEITIRNSQVDSSSNAISDNPAAFGNAGTIQLQARQIFLNGGRITTIVSIPQGLGGDIAIAGQSLLLRNGSSISTNAGIDQRFGGGDGGKISINAGVIAAVESENSDITANAFDGRGGNVQITTEGLFGIAFRPRPDDRLSDITASSEFGLDGTVTINGLVVDPSQGLVELPAQPVDASRLIARGCGTAGTAIALAQREFVVSGRGGLPAAPGDLQGSGAIAASWADPGSPGYSANRPLRPSNPPQTLPSPAPLTEAQGWIRDDSGQVRLVAEVPMAAGSQIASVACASGRPDSPESHSE
ncbi:filamentous hemagglutinin N-terminal domain-containing protein [Thermoleptolyngbya oregonensis NK1-22]|uniref:Filamentous hemagglutinin N-terminal domain-containing protein n=1 Tax=Thermoleptolyngbya oregonensis NK1-22 TaxID=2547457 RepID=A0AA96YSA1_9CYAN|nr:filamentous hemagglutinin N-terminal domain-containing protein [Thermoleptolyngbya oregonensis]WOB45457.1 filamentous hemagglutinin N-terminal domain-containing protein [Thermoleptolyngbya oregonensis NK1-22]